MIAIIDYDTGNTRNVKKAMDFLAIPNTLSADPDVISSADGLILPGVGAFGKAVEALKVRGLIPVIQQAAKQGMPILGICLGMQLLFDRSFEFGETAGLGLIPGEVVAIPENLGVKVPHMGWDQNQVTRVDPIANGFDQQSTYFVHSYYVKTRAQYILAESDYGVKIPSIVRHQNVIGMQFHPEKSGRIGLNGLAAFKELVLNGNYSRN
ncbi:imidazole glycerol phosphate synthase subunit HisH [Lactobacillus sp. LC28-10]|uniref:Imidazole glycerol phosphate synthase subunit HisH n=1 Tax=Secundilactobacillus angelensis TaxID=2722706 RepID=A0ABX1KXS9_9LACO|nr:imidazole glycerol phosphate synthase subunit HisH [Secundilactobacillus angelensis]MCH5462478.1 imidazole glycerol phosphate synthase subunit HisH [Secundilactobacillus angelensis]NLR18040.1 imidazole glycerol phosphate synthase subunit HisH [Secundilactobacillus angelensis]